MNVSFDLSLNTIVQSIVIVGVGLAMRGIAWALIEAIKTLVTRLIETIAKVELIDAKMGKIVDTVGDVEKMRRDINEYYRQLKELKKELEEKFN